MGSDGQPRGSFLPMGIRVPKGGPPYSIICERVGCGMPATALVQGESLRDMLPDSERGTLLCFLHLVEMMIALHDQTIQAGFERGAQEAMRLTLSRTVLEVNEEATIADGDEILAEIEPH